MIMMFANSIALYFVLTYHVILDKTMMGNVFNTNVREVTSYYSPEDIHIFAIAWCCSCICYIENKYSRIKKITFGSAIVWFSDNKCIFNLSEFFHMALD